MMNIVLFDDQRVKHFYPLSYTRSIADFRLGIFTIKEKWSETLAETVFILPEDFLKAKYFPTQVLTKETLYINSRYFPTKNIFDQIQLLEVESILLDDQDQSVVAFKTNDFFTTRQSLLDRLAKNSNTCLKLTSNPEDFIKYRWDIFQKNHFFIAEDIQIKLKKGIEFEAVSSSNQVLGSEVYIEKGAVVECSMLNSLTGPIYVSKGAEIMEGCMVRGGLALCEGAQLKMGSKIYGATTIGPHCKIGGEVNNSVIFGYSNKAHDGFLGNSILAEWCNLGADTNNSNLKNNYGEVDVWDYEKGAYINTQQQFVGLCMGDHSKAGINTMFNTGTVVGCFANIYGGDFPEKFIPDFSWGSAHHFTEHTFEKAMHMADRVMQRRNISLSPKEQEIFLHVFHQSSIYRK